MKALGSDGLMVIAWCTRRLPARFDPGGDKSDPGRYRPWHTPGDLPRIDAGKLLTRCLGDQKRPISVAGPFQTATAQREAVKSFLVSTQHEQGDAAIGVAAGVEGVGPDDSVEVNSSLLRAFEPEMAVTSFDKGLDVAQGIGRSRDRGGRSPPDTAGPHRAGNPCSVHYWCFRPAPASLSRPARSSG